MPSVLFVAPSAYPLGGVAVWLDYLVAGLPDCGWKAKVALVSGRWHDPDRYAAVYPRIPWVEVRNPTGSAEGRLRALSRVMREEAPSVVVGVNIADVYRACQRLRRQTSAPMRTVMAIHGVAADLLEDLRRDRGYIDAVIGTNRLTCRLTSRLAGMPIGRVHYAPYGVDVGGLDASARGRRPPGPLRIAYVGRLDHAQKRVDTIPEILRHLDRRRVDFRFDIAGDGPARETLRESLAPWLADGRAVMLGVVPPDDLAERVYARADALLVTSSWETGPIVIWEAMAAGVPVVTSRYVGSGLEGALKHGDNCLMFPVGDAEQAARQLAKLTSSDAGRRLADRAHRLVADRYSIEQSVQAWARALDAVCRTPSDPAPEAEPQPHPAGRLDRLLGASKGESVRRCLGFTFPHCSAGDEWPHTMYPGAQNDPQFWERVFGYEEWPSE